MLVEACTAITRDPERAACIETLTIRFNHLGRFNIFLRQPMRGLANVLASVPNLKAMDIQCWSHLDRLSKILCAQRGHPFRLEKFACIQPLHDSIDSFVRAQPTIADYFITGHYFCEDDEKPDILLDRLSNQCLPNLRHFCGPPKYVRRYLRSRTVDTIEITGGTTGDDILDLYSRFYRHPAAKRDEIARGDGRHTIAWNVCMSLCTSEEEHHHFPFLISISNRISLSHIRSLKLHSWAKLDQESVPRALKLFLVLEYFEWDTMDYILDVKADWVTKFVHDCAANALRLCRITLSNTGEIGLYRVWSKVLADTVAKDEFAAAVCHQKPVRTDEEIERLSMASADSDWLASMPLIHEGAEWAWQMETFHIGQGEPCRKWEIDS